MENVIRITVTGGYNSGKTAISQEIVDTLRNLGFAVKWEVKPDYNKEQEARLDGVERLDKLESISDRTTIVVREERVKRDFNAILNYRVDEHVDNKEK